MSQRCRLGAAENVSSSTNEWVVGGLDYPIAGASGTLGGPYKRRDR